MSVLAEQLAARVLREFLLANLPAKVATLNASGERNAYLLAATAGPYTIPAGASLGFNILGPGSTFTAVPLTAGSRTATQLAADIATAAVSGVVGMDDGTGRLKVMAGAAPIAGSPSRLFLGPDTVAGSNALFGWDPGGDGCVRSPLVAPGTKGVCDGWPVNLADCGAGFYIILGDRSSQPKEWNLRRLEHRCSIHLDIASPVGEEEVSRSREHISSCLRAVRELILTDRLIAAQALGVTVVLETGSAVAGKPFYTKREQLPYAFDAAGLDLTVDIYERPDAVPVFQVLPAMFTAGGGVLTGTKGEVITFSRASAGACLTAPDGSSLVSLGVDLPRVESNGFLMEDVATNLCIRGDSFDHAAWTRTNVTLPVADTIVAPDGATTAEVLTSTVAGGFIESTAAVITGTAGAVRVYVKAPSGTTQAGKLVLRDTTAGVDVASTTFTAGDTWQHVSTASAAGVTTGHSHSLRLYPGGAAGTGTLHAARAQVEAWEAATSPVPTTSAAVVRATESASYNVAFALTTRPRFTATFRPNAIVAVNNRYLLSAVIDATTYWLFYIGPSGVARFRFGKTGGTSVGVTSSNLVNPGVDNTLEAWYDGDATYVKLNGVTTRALDPTLAAIVTTSFASLGVGCVTVGGFGTLPLQGDLRAAALFASSSA